LAVYLFGLALCLIPLTLAVGSVQAAYRLARRLVTLRETAFSISMKRARPGDTIEAHARVLPRSSLAITVHARLTCTMFDHRSHELYASSRAMRPVAAATNEYVVSLTLPDYALRTGLVGDKSPSSSVEGARRMLVVWTVDFEVRSPGGIVLRRTSCGLEVPAGRRPKTRLRRMSLLAIDAFSSIRNDMLFNWLVHLAVCDGAINPTERRLLRDLLDEMNGMVAGEDADARIEQELQRRLVIDDVFLQRYVPLNERLEFYRALYSLARSDGTLHQRELEFLSDALKVFRLSADDVKQVGGDTDRDEAAPDQIL
jgi:DnaJ-domain-containing protein 1